MQSLQAYLAGRQPQEVRGYVTAPTGAGKTVLFVRLLEDLRERGELGGTLIVVPSLVLKEQVKQALLRHGFRGTIQLMHSSLAHDPRADILITTQSGFVQQLRRERSRGINPSLVKRIIFDEAHHMQGEGTRMVIRDRVAHAAIMGFTATPDYDERRKLSNLLPDVIHEITIREGVDESLIAPYATLVLPTNADMSHVLNAGKEYLQYLLEEAVTTDPRNQAIAAFYAAVMPGTPALFNTAWVDHAEEMASVLQAYGVKAAAVHGRLDKTKRKELIEAFSNGDIQVLTQAKLLGEGYDEPRIEAVFNVVPSLSKVRVQQRVGRGQRVDPDNPEKLTLVIECADLGYQAPPVLYGSDKIAGAWQYFGRSEIDFTGRLRDLTARAGELGFDIMTDPAEIEQWHGGLKSRRGSAPTPTRPPRRLPARNILGGDILPPDGLSPFEVMEEPEHLLKAQTRLSASELRVRQHLRDFQDRREADSFDLDDDDDVSVSAYHQAETLRNSAQKALAGFILDGSTLTGVAVDSVDIRQTLRMLAGTIELQDPTVLHRYQMLNTTLHSNGLSSQEMLADLTTRSRSTGSFRSFVLDQFRPEDAACAPQESLAAHPLEAAHHTEKFYPERGHATRPAKEICHTCPFIGECLDFALVNGIKHGIWGGMSERQRLRVRKAFRDSGEAATRELIEQYWAKEGAHIEMTVPITLGTKKAEKEEGDPAQNGSNGNARAKPPQKPTSPKNVDGFSKHECVIMRYMVENKGRELHPGELKSLAGELGVSSRNQILSILAKKLRDHPLGEYLQILGSGRWTRYLFDEELPEDLFERYPFLQPVELPKAASV